MSYVPYNFPWTGGLDRTKVASKSDLGSFYTMANMRQSNSVLGQIEQTPRFYNSSTLSQGTHWNGGGSQSELSASAVVWTGDADILGTPLNMTQYCVFYGSIQVKCFFQSAQPSTTGVTKGCLFKALNVGSMTVTLGGSYDVVIDATNTFKWRVNAGAYTTGVVIDQVNGNLIDGSTVRLYWLASTGFTVNDTWSWSRWDTAGASSAVLNSNLAPLLVNHTLYYLDSNGRLMLVEQDNVLTTYVRSAGYRYVYGHSLGFFEEHLFVFGGFPNSTSTIVYIQNSDNVTSENFIATDVNEADTTILNITSGDPVTSFATLDGFVLRNRLYVLTTSGIFYSDYFGLPAPFSFKQLLSIPLSSFTGRCWTTTLRSTYILRTDALFTFDGTSVKSLLYFTDLGLGTPTHILYNSLDEEVIVNFPKYILVYQENYNTYYTRSLDFAGVGHTCLTYNPTGTLYAGAVSRKLYKEDLTFTAPPAYDSATGSAYAAPTLTTQLIGNTCERVKEITSVYLSAYSSPTAATYYSVGSYNRVTMSWLLSNDGLMPSTETTNANSYWTSAAKDGKLSFPRTPYRYIAFKFAITGTDGSKPAGIVSLQGLETNVYNSKEVVQ